MRLLRFIVGLAALATVTLLAALVVLAALLPPALGLDRIVLVSGSMSPSMVVGDVVLVDRDLDRPATPGAVLVFADPSRPGELVTHRVVQTLPDGSYRTQGDANDVPDSTPVTAEMVQGRGRLLVPHVGYPAAMLQQGATGRAVLVLVALGALVALSRYGLLAKFDPWSAPPHGRLRPPARTGPSQAALVTGAGVLVLAAAVLTPQMTRASYLATTGNANGFLQQAQRWYLKSSGTGNVASSPTLPLATTSPTQTTLPNYDTDRNSSPGLTVAKGNGLAETDPVKIQKWNLSISSATTLSGTARLTLWTAMKDFDLTKPGSVPAGLYDCNSTQSNCVAFGSAPTMSQTPWSTVSGGWTSKTWNFGVVSRSLAAGRVLQVRVATMSTSGDDIMFAYDTTAHPSALVVG